MDVGKALRNTSKGQLKYDRHWMEEGRTKEVLDNISRYSSKVALNISPKILSQVIISLEEEKSQNVEENEISSPSDSNVQQVKELNNRNRESDTVFYELQTETEVPILEYEEERLKYVHHEVFKTKKDEFENFSKSLEQQIEQQYHLSKRNFELDVKRRAADLKKIEDAIVEEAREKDFLLKQQHQTQAKKLSAIVQEAEMKIKRADEELKKKQQEQEDFFRQLNNCRMDINNSFLKAQEKLKACEHHSFLKVHANDRLVQMTEFIKVIESVWEQAQTEPLKIEDVYNANDLVKKTYEALKDIVNDIEQAKVKALHDHDKKLKEAQETPIYSEENREFNTRTVSAVSNETVGVKTVTVDKSKENEKNIKNEMKQILSGFIAPDVIEDYHRISENLKNVQNSVQSFSNDPNNKKFRFDLQKSINVPINAISSVSGAHVRDKISRLLSILNAKASGNEANNESVVYNFCCNLIARKFVEQGDKQISAQHSTAFPIALAVVGVWIKKPEVGTLILGHFYANCPYLVPYYPPRKENQSNQEYYESLGYYFDKEGNMEAKYKFLNRMSGFMRLYAAILLSPVPPSSIKYPHPHGIAFAWRWLAGTLNMDPRPDITATLLYDFLDVTGHELQRTYGKQFKKLLHIICKDYFKKIKEVTPSGSGGPVERLETFLQQTIKKGYVPPPEGILEADFWNR